MTAYVGTPRIVLENGKLKLREDAFQEAAEATIDRWSHPPHERVLFVLQAIFGEVQIIRAEPIEED